MKIKSLLLTTAALCVMAASASAATLNFTGTTDGNPVYNRSTESPFDLSVVGDNVPYYAQAFTVSADGSYDLSVIANDPGSYDTFLHLYSAAFDPLLPLSNLLAANDDAVFGSAELGSALSFALTSGQTYFMVIDGFGNFDFGGFSASISGPGSISTSVPDAGSTFTLAGVALMGLVFMRRSLAVVR